jgi:TorA maturation chaperone TorD
MLFQESNGKEKKMFINNELKHQNDLLSILQSRLYLNQLIRFILDSPPEKNALLKIVDDPIFISLCKINHACHTIQTGIQSLLSNDHSLLPFAQEEYNRLFVGPNALPAPLWESVYLSKEHIMFEKQTLQVRERYRQHDLSFVNGKNEPDDHILIELEFLSYLIEQTILGSTINEKQNYLDNQISFLDDHLLKWCPKFCELLSESTEFEFFKGTAMLLHEYIGLEKELAITIKEALQNE